MGEIDKHYMESIANLSLIELKALAVTWRTRVEEIPSFALASRALVTTQEAIRILEQRLFTTKKK